MSAWTSESCTSKWPTCKPPGAGSPADLLRPGGLRGSFLPPAALLPETRTRMHRLLCRYFSNVRGERFEADLQEKDEVLLLQDASGEVAGFTTLKRLCLTVCGEPVTAFFSGDTIVREECRNELLLPRLWLAHVFALADGVDKGRCFWFLISSGFRTYRFLPVYFRHFLPSGDGREPAHLRAVLDRLAAARFGPRYDARQGLVLLREPAPLRERYCEIPDSRLADPWVRRFLALNPGHARGDELACLAELSRENLTRAGARMLGVEDRG